MTDTASDQKILISNSNNKGTAVEVGFKGDGSITIKSNGPVTVLSPTITLEAGEKGTITMHAKTIMMEAQEEVQIVSATKSITLSAQEDVALEAKKLQGTIGQDISLHASSTVRISSPDSDVL
jgi:2-phospho-L-lactate guanylyltransferase (CobY/MobA/RfbA family)